MNELKPLTNSKCSVKIQYLVKAKEVQTSQKSSQITICQQHRNKNPFIITVLPFVAIRELLSLFHIKLLNFADLITKQNVLLLSNICAAPTTSSADSSFGRSTATCRIVGPWVRFR